MNEIEIVEYDEKYRQSASNLLKRVFPGLSNERNLSWRFEKLDEHEPIIVCAVDSENVIGITFWKKWLFTWKDNTFVGYQAGEGAIDGNYRRLGIWKKILNLGEKIARDRGYIDFFYGFPNPISFKGLIKGGYFHVGDYHSHIRIINPFLLNLIKKRNKNASPGPDPIFLRQEQYITPIVNSNYMEWRYNRNAKNYKVVSYIENNKTAIFILRQKKYYNKKFRISFPEVLILDCQFTSYDKQFMHNSFKYIDSLFKRKGVWIRTFFNEGTDKGRALRRHFHFNFKHQSIKFIFKKINPALDSAMFSEVDNWDLLPHVVDSW